MRRRRWVAVVLSVVGAAALYLFWNPNGEIYLVPEGYRGPIVVAFNHPRGVKRERTIDAYVYRIPRDGILRIRDSMPEGFKMFAWFFVDAQGKRTRIPELQRDDDGHNLSWPHVTEIQSGGDFVEARIVIPSDIDSFYPATHFTTDKVREEYRK